MPTPMLKLLALAALAFTLSACGTEDGSRDEEAAAAPGAFSTIEREARGQTVRWWMYGGDDRINAYVDEHVVPAAAQAGVDARARAGHRHRRRRCSGSSPSGAPARTAAAAST